MANAALAYMGIKMAEAKKKGEKPKKPQIKAENLKNPKASVRIKEAITDTPLNARKQIY